MENWKFALSSILSHKMRSFLTMLGIIIGVASVVVIMALGEGMKQGVTGTLTREQQYAQLFYSPKSGNYIAGLSLSEDDASEDIADTPPIDPPVVQEEWLKELVKIDGVEGYYATNSVSATISHKAKKSNNVTITGVNETYFEVRKFDLMIGRKLVSADYQNFSRVILLDERLAQSLFESNEQALNQIVSVGELSYRVVGIYKDPNAGSSMYGMSSGGNAIMANTQVSAEYAIPEIVNTNVYIPEVELIKEVGVAAAKELTRLSGVSQGQFQIFNMDSLLEQINSQVSIMTSVIGAIAGISLLVGGVGVMNIMLVSVTERTREIGLRKAIGATRSNILLQFLIESMVLTLIGGLIGLGLAYGLTAIIASTAAGIFGGTPTISIVAVIGSLTFSAFVGIIFGILPANKASKLDPIEALRYE